MPRYITNTPINLYVNDSDATPRFVCMVPLDEHVIADLRRVIREWEASQPSTEPLPTGAELVDPTARRRRVLRRFDLPNEDALADVRNDDDFGRERRVITLD